MLALLIGQNMRPKYDGENSLIEIANKLIELNNINKESIIGGSSLGGIVALEIAQIVNAKKALLIGSTQNPNLINPILKSLSSLADFTPIKLIQLFSGKSNNDLLNMFSELDAEFIKAMCKALSKWQGIDNYKGLVFQIHGQNDHIIKPATDNTELISYAGHLIALTHPKEVSFFIKKHTH